MQAPQRKETQQSSRPAFRPLSGNDRHFPSFPRLTCFCQSRAGCAPQQSSWTGWRPWGDFAPWILNEGLSMKGKVVGLPLRGVTFDRSVSSDLIRSCMFWSGLHGSLPWALTAVCEELRVWSDPDLGLDLGAATMNGAMMDCSGALVFWRSKIRLIISTLSLCVEVLIHKMEILSSLKSCEIKWHNECSSSGTVSCTWYNF